jgi:hypothetical protein
VDWVRRGGGNAAEARNAVWIALFAGFLALFAFGVWQSPKEPPPNQTTNPAHRDAKRETVHAQGKQVASPATAEDRIAGYTLWLMVSTDVLTAVSIAQSGFCFVPIKRAAWPPISLREAPT